MDDVWDNLSRFRSIHEALNRLSHDEIAVGLGFKLTHNPANCIRCRANIAALELSSIVQLLENELSTKKPENKPGQVLEEGREMTPAIKQGLRG